MSQNLLAACFVFDMVIFDIVNSMSISYLVCRELGKKIRIVGKRLDFEASSVNIDSEELCSVTRKSDLFDLVGVDKSEEFGISNVCGSTAGGLDDHLDFSGLSRRKSNLFGIDIECHGNGR